VFAEAPFGRPDLGYVPMSGKERIRALQFAESKLCPKTHFRLQSQPNAELSSIKAL
jgi:hypothetical protein